MENTLANLHYILKDTDVQEHPYICSQINELLLSLSIIIRTKQERWNSCDTEDCPCGCSRDDVSN